MSSIVFTRWELVAVVVVCVVVGVLLAAALIGRALRWKAGMNGRKGGK